LGKEKIHNAKMQKKNQSENSPSKVQKPNNKLVQRSKCTKVEMHKGHKSQMLNTLN
jgi:hypothetical protein